MANTFELIATANAGSSGSSYLEFTSIPSTYTDLLIYFSGRSNNAFTANDLLVELNSSSSGFNWINVYGRNTSTTIASQNNTNNGFGSFNGASTTTNQFSNTQIYIANYANTSYNKSAFTHNTVENANTTGDNVITTTKWTGTSAISSIRLIPESGGLLVQYSNAYLYGIKNS